MKILRTTQEARFQICTDEISNDKSEWDITFFSTYNNISKHYLFGVH